MGDLGRAKSLLFLLTREAKRLPILPSRENEFRDSLNSLKVLDSGSEWLVEAKVGNINRKIEVPKGQFVFYATRDSAKYPDDPYILNTKAAELILEDLFAEFLTEQIPNRKPTFTTNFLRDNLSTFSQILFFLLVLIGLPRLTEFANFWFFLAIVSALFFTLILSSIAKTRLISFLPIFFATSVALVSQTVELNNSIMLFLIVHFSFSVLLSEYPHYIFRLNMVYLVFLFMSTYVVVSKTFLLGLSPAGHYQFIIFLLGSSVLFILSHSSIPRLRVLLLPTIIVVQVLILFFVFFNLPESIFAIPLYLIFQYFSIFYGRNLNVNGILIPCLIFVH